MKTEEKIYLYGRNALKEALTAKPAAIQKVFLDKNASADAQLMSLLTKHAIAVSEMKESSGALDRDAVHQGVIAQLNTAALYTDLETILKNEGSEPQQNALVLLDELQDPHNVGAIIRSAAAFGIAAVLIPEHNQAPITGTVIKTSAGMVFRVPIVRVGNVNQTLRTLKEYGYWIYGLAGDGAQSLTTTTFDTSVVFVIGNEGDGIREKTLELCDFKLSIPIEPACESLNAAVATAVVLYEWAKGK